MPAFNTFAEAVADYKHRRAAGELSDRENQIERDICTRRIVHIIRKYGAQAVIDWEAAQLRARREERR